MTRVARMNNVRHEVSQTMLYCIEQARSRDEVEEVLAVAIVTVASFFETPEVAVKFLMEVAK